MIIKLRKSSRASKKYMVVFEDGKKIHFGSKGYGDYPTHKNEKRKESYVARHRKNEDWNNMKTAGFWAKNLLWNKPSFSASIKDVEERYDIKIDH